MSRRIAGQPAGDTMTAGLVGLSVLIGLGGIYWFLIRKTYRHWGATGAEVERPMLGDAEVPRRVGSTLFMCVLEPAAFVMTRKMLLGIKRRAETAARSHDVATRAA
jgi:hypothetical protein